MYFKNLWYLQVRSECILNSYEFTRVEPPTLLSSPPPSVCPAQCSATQDSLAVSLQRMRSSPA